MQIAGKCSPERDALAAASDRGFDAVELHLGSWDGDVAAATDAVAAAAVEAVAVHTPHATPDDADAFRRADRLAAELDAYLVVHSQYANHVHVPDLEAIGFESAHGYENNPGASVRHLEATVLDAGHDLVLDTAHLYTATADYLAATERLLADWGDQMPVVHLCDSTLTDDGLGFGRGEMAMGDLSRLLKREYDGVSASDGRERTDGSSDERSEYDGVVVLEVPLPDQADAIRRFESY